MAETQVQISSHDLGVKLEDLVANIFRNNGYDIAQRVIVMTKSGAGAEIDLVVEKSGLRRPVECKNLAITVGVASMRVFKDKLSDANLTNGLFVTNTRFSVGAKKVAHAAGIELWDMMVLREEFFRASLGRSVDTSILEVQVGNPLVRHYKSDGLRKAQAFYEVSTQLRKHSSNGLVRKSDLVAGLVASGQFDEESARAMTKHRLTHAGSIYEPEPGYLKWITPRDSY